jgi:hypothetical protein
VRLSVMFSSRSRSTVSSSPPFILPVCNAQLPATPANATLRAGRTPLVMGVSLVSVVTEIRAIVRWCETVGAT